MAPTAKTLAYLAQEKTLESSFVRDEDERPKVAYNQFSDEIPVISLAGIDDVHGRRQGICQKIVEACENWGIFQVVDHGVDQKLVSEMTRLATQFFALPPEEKLRFDMSGGKKGGFIVSSHLQVTFVLRCFALFFFYIFSLNIQTFYFLNIYFNICVRIIKLLTVTQTDSLSLYNNNNNNNIIERNDV